MKRALVTGATGLLGNAIARRLHQEGIQVRALVRDPVRARALLPDGIDLTQRQGEQPRKHCDYPADSTK